MFSVTNAGTAWPGRSMAFALATWAACTAGAANAADPGKQACLGDAKRLCHHEMAILSRSRVRACLIAHMEQTSPVCHDFMVKERAKAMAGQRPDPSAQ